MGGVICSLAQQIAEAYCKVPEDEMLVHTIDSTTAVKSINLSQPADFDNPSVQKVSSGGCAIQQQQALILDYASLAVRAAPPDAWPHCAVHATLVQAQSGTMPQGPHAPCLPLHAAGRLGLA
jgi:hypothetical protein